MSTTQRATVPPREAWPEPPPRTEAGDLFTEVVLTTFPRISPPPAT
jgi:hypothetical protein